jgi:hypothetical protein
MKIIFHFINNIFKNNIFKNNIFKNNNILLKQDKIILGRWNIDHCPKKINNKIDMSNLDHCGPCGQYSFNHFDKIVK